MNTLTKTLAGTAAAGTAALGVVASLDFSDDTAKAYVDDIKPIAVRKYAVRKFAVAKPEVRKFTVTKPEVPKTEVAKVAVTKLEVSKTDVSMIEISKADVSVFEVAALEVGSVDVTKHEVTSFAELLRRGIELQKTQRELFRDQRNLMFDGTIGLNSANWMRWIGIYRNAKPYALKQVPFRRGMRMIAEAGAVKSADERKTLSENLQYYAGRGYDSVLLTFDLSERLEELEEAVELIRAAGLKIWIAYSGPEDLRHSVFVPPQKLEQYLFTLAGYAEGLVLGWRRTALHQLLQDRPFTDLLLRAARRGNARLQVLGESYIGETTETPEYTRTPMFHNPDGVSGTIVSGLGFYGVNVRGALSGVFAPVADMERVALIVGSRPYHQTLHPSGLTSEQERRIKVSLESKFRAAGCTGTITLHGDGGTVTRSGVKVLTDLLNR